MVREDTGTAVIAPVKNSLRKRRGRRRDDGGAPGRTWLCLGSPYESKAYPLIMTDQPKPKLESESDSGREREQGSLMDEDELQLVKTLCMDLGSTCAPRKAPRL